MATATATACSRGSQGREGKREPEEGEWSRGSGENEGRLWVSPWRREDVGEAATAKQEVEASACARACGVRPPGRGGRGQGGGGGGLGQQEELGRLGWTGNFLLSVFF